MRWRLLFFFFSCLIICPPLFAFEDQGEKILNFDSTIVVNKDASIDITEIISVYAAQIKIIHGIVRRLPTRNTHYQLQQVLFNNTPSAYHTEHSYSQLAIYIGNADVVLPPGIYVYTISYHVNHAINFLQDTDELYWNITGNEWDFPILKASVDIQLPEGAKILNYAAYTGATGEKGQNFYARAAANNEISFTTTAPLMPGEGLTIAVAWPKGVIQPPTMWQQVKMNFQENKVEYILLEIIGLIFFYYLAMWSWHGRHWRRRIIPLLFEPPLQLSPAALRYIKHMRPDIKMFTAAIVDMAVKGALVIQNNDGVFSLEEKNKQSPQLAAEEKSGMEALFLGNSSMTLEAKNAKEIRRARLAVNTSLKNAYKNVYFTDNSRYLIPGLLLTVFAYILVALSSDHFILTLFTLTMITILGALVVNRGIKACTDIGNAYEIFSFSLLKSALTSSIGFIAIAIICISMIITDFPSLPFLLIPLLFLLMVLNFIFYQLLQVPTAEGFKLIDQIEGFKLFLQTATTYRLNQLNLPQKGPMLFEAYLPYAIALDVENAWGEKFNHLVQEAETETTYRYYSPVWYRGTSPCHPTAFPVVLNSSLTGAISTSSSASSGGGASGGGGGGGGGGGW
ncbi:MAG: DUF2207 domain-containing protein [Gammaproteobacteria bacterium]|nr:MAG: DUF2207 domain-containing protein [Gammaproteobacteria bacterium]